MTTYARVVLPLAAFGALLFGCVTPAVRDVVRDAQPRHLYRIAEPRGVHISVAPVVDRRPKMEVVSTNQTAPRYVVPVIIWNQWSTAGPVFGHPTHYGPNLIPGLRSLIHTTLRRGGLQSEGGQRYSLQAELHHFYGVNYNKKWFLFTPWSASSLIYSFFPLGYVGLSLRLVDPSGKVVGARYLTESFLFNPFARRLTTRHSAYGPGVNIVDNRSMVPMIALQLMMNKLPAVVDQMLAERGASGAKDPTGHKTFKLIRLTREYDFQQEMVVEVESGRIISNKMVRRRIPILSRPGEWVVAPIAPSGRFMGSKEYARFVERIKQKYDVVFGSNLSAATFRGVRGATPRPGRKEVGPPADPDPRDI